MKTKKHLPRLAIALIVALALSLTAAAAVYVFRNSILVSDKSDIPEPQGDTPVAVGLVSERGCAAFAGGRNRGTPHYCR